MSLDDAARVVVLRYHKWRADAARPGYVGGYRRRQAPREVPS